MYPLWVRFENMSWSPGMSIFGALFPFFGLLAFSLLWLHAMAGVFEPWLRKHINFDSFVHHTSLVILISIIAHPILLLVSLKFKIGNIFLIYDPLYIWLAIIGWLLLITYDIVKPLRKYEFFAKHWQNVLTVSTIGFLITFFHSLKLGSDLQTNPLRAVWIFYGVTAILATIYTYGIKRFLLK